MQVGFMNRSGRTWPLKQTFPLGFSYTEDTRQNQIPLCRFTCHHLSGMRERDPERSPTYQRVVKCFPVAQFELFNKLWAVLSAGVGCGGTRCLARSKVPSELWTANLLGVVRLLKEGRCNRKGTSLESNMKGEKNRIKLSVGIASTACTRCVPKTTYDIPKKQKEGSASRMQMWELELLFP